MRVDTQAAREGEAAVEYGRMKDTHLKEILVVHECSEVLVGHHKVEAANADNLSDTELCEAIDQSE